MWIEAINDSVTRHSDNESSNSDTNPLVAHYKENIYEAFQSRVFLDECSLDNLLQAFNEVHSMFKSGVEDVLDQTKSNPEIHKKVITIRNLSQTMGKLI